MFSWCTWETTYTSLGQWALCLSMLSCSARNLKTFKSSLAWSHGLKKSFSESKSSSPLSLTIPRHLAGRPALHVRSPQWFPLFKFTSWRAWSRARGVDAARLVRLKGEKPSVTVTDGWVSHAYHRPGRSQPYIFLIVYLCQCTCCPDIPITCPW